MPKPVLCLLTFEKGLKIITVHRYKTKRIDLYECEMNERFTKSSSDWELPMVCSFKHFFLILQQILVPESQISPVEEELVSLKEKANPQEEFAKPPKYIKNSNQGDIKNSQPKVYMASK